MKKSTAIVLLHLFACSLLITNCTSDPEIDPGVAPELPPLTTFLMDFDIVGANGGGRVSAKSNWGYSALNVGIWNTAIAITFAIPVASFAESFNSEPTFDASLPGWVWEYDYSIQSNVFNARLEGKIDSESVEWDMYITDIGAFADYNWYSGSSSLDGLSGSWTLNQHPTDPRPFLKIDWNRLADNEAANIRYTNVIPEANNNGNYIFFERDDAANFDRSYTVFSMPLNNTTDIEWSSKNKNGRVRDPNQFGDNEFHCWDELLEDIDCP